MLDESEPVDATYVLAADYHDWKALFEGYDALRTVMISRGAIVAVRGFRLVEHPALADIPFAPADDEIPCAAAELAAAVARSP